MSSGYRILDSQSVLVLLERLADVRARLGASPCACRVREVGDGNLNLVFIIEGPSGSVCVKQALPYVRAAGPSWPMSLERAYFEKSYYLAVAPYVGARIPVIFFYHPELFCIVMERLSPHVVLRHGLIAGRRYPHLARDMGEYVARACFFTSDLARPFERKMEGIARFAGNTALIRISVDLVFNDPYTASRRNHHTSPQLDAVASDFRRDGDLKSAVARFGQKFLGSPEALLHGDLHSGSVMVSAEDTRVIDPEFAFYGPIGFDLGAFFGNLLLNWYSQPGHATSGADRTAYQAWILEQSRSFWETFRRCFLALWAQHGAGDVYPSAMFSSPQDMAAIHTARNSYLDSLFADMLGFGACKMIRRILGFAHVMDFDSIADPDLRARCEGNALSLARLVLKHPRQFPSLDALMDAVPRAGNSM